MRDERCENADERWQGDCRFPIHRSSLIVHRLLPARTPMTARLAVRVGCLLLLLPFLAATGGCSNIRSLPIRQPVTDFRGLTVENVTADGVDLAFEFNLENSNDFYLPVTGAQYKLDVGGIRVVEDVTKPAE